MAVTGQNCLAPGLRAALILLKTVGPIPSDHRRGNSLATSLRGRSCGEAVLTSREVKLAGYWQIGLLDVPLGPPVTVMLVGLLHWNG